MVQDLGLGRVTEVFAKVLVLVCVLALCLLKVPVVVAEIRLFPCNGGSESLELVEEPRVTKGVRETILDVSE